MLHGQGSPLPPRPDLSTANKGEPAAPTAGPAAPNPGPDTTAANAAGAGGSGSGSAAAAPGSSHEDEAANQQAAEGSAAAERLLYRAELVTLLYDKLAERFVLPGQVPQKLGAKPKASTVGWVGGLVVAPLRDGVRRFALAKVKGVCGAVWPQLSGCTSTCTCDGLRVGGADERCQCCRCLQQGHVTGVERHSRTNAILCGRVKAGVSSCSMAVAHGTYRSAARR